MPRLRNILVVKLGALGDFIQALGPMAAIRRAHRDASITLLTTAPYAALGRDCGYFDEVIVDRRPRWIDIGGWLSLRSMLNARRFDRVYDLQNNDRTALYLKLFSPRPEWVGAAAGASHRNSSKLRNAGKAFDGHCQTLALAGIHDVTVDPLDWMRGNGDVSELQPPYVLVVPGGSARHPKKRWSADRYAEFCARLHNRGFQPVLIGTDEERDTTRRIAEAVEGSIDLTGRTTLYDLASLARGASGAIGNDTGPMHVIAPTGCRALVLFSGVSDPHRHAPLGAHVATIQKDDLGSLPLEDVWEAFAAQQSRT